MTETCKNILYHFASGTSLFEICRAEGMPGYEQVKSWLLEKEYHQQYEEFRNHFLQISENMYPILLDELSAFVEDMEYDTIVNSKGFTVTHPDKWKNYQNFYTALRWYPKHLRLLHQLYEAHARGEDPSEHSEAYHPSRRAPKALGGEGQGACPPEEGEVSPSNTLRSLEKLINSLGSGSFSLGGLGVGLGGSRGNSLISRTLTREQAEILLGTPLLYGRQPKPKKPKTKPIPPSPESQRSVPQPSEPQSAKPIVTKSVSYETLKAFEQDCVPNLLADPCSKIYSPDSHTEIKNSVRQFLIDQHLIPP